MTPEQELERDFFEKLGRAIGNWALVEMQLFRVFARLIQAEDSDITAQAFHAVTGFRNRLKMTHAAARAAEAAKRASLASVNWAEWKRVKKRASDLSEIRNHFAHWTVYFNISTGGPPPTPRVSLRRSYFDPKSADHQQHDARDLEKADANFASLVESLRLFADTLPKPASSSPGGLV